MVVVVVVVDVVVAVAADKKEVPGVDHHVLHYRRVHPGRLPQPRRVSQDRPEGEHKPDWNKTGRKLK